METGLFSENAGVGNYQSKSKLGHFRSVFDILCRFCYDIQDVEKESELNALKRLLVILLVLCLTAAGGCAQTRVLQPVQSMRDMLTAELEAEKPALKWFEPEPGPTYSGRPDLIPDTDETWTVVADGQTLQTTVYVQNGVQYLCLGALERALDVKIFYNEDEASFNWKGSKVRLVRGAPNYFYGENIVNLGDAVPLSCREGFLIPVEALCRCLKVGFFRDTEQQTIYVTPEAGKFDIPGGVCVPTLMYHAVSDQVWGDTELFVGPEAMEAQLKYLTENGYTTIFFEDLAYADRIEKPVLLTFDDGYADNYHELFPLLQKYNCKATIFVVTDLVDQAEHKMTSEQIRELADSGLVSIQSHTASHPHLRRLSAEQQRQEMLLFRSETLGWLKQRVRWYRKLWLRWGLCLY